MRAFAATALLVLAAFSALAQDSGAKLQPVMGDGEKPFVAPGEIGDIRGSDYVFAFPDAANPAAATLYRLDAQAAREVKDAKGAAVSFAGADFFPDGDGLYARARTKEAETLWWVSGLVAAPVKAADDKPLAAQTLTVSAAVNPHVLAMDKSGASIWRLEQGLARLVISRDTTFTKQFEFTLFPGPVDLVVGLCDFTAVAPRVALHNVVKGELVAINDALGQPARAVEYSSRVAGQTHYLCESSLRQRNVFVVAAGKIQPLLKPDGTQVNKDLRFAQVLDDALLLALRDGDGQNDALWAARGSKLEPVNTVEGPQLKSPNFTTQPMGGRALINAFDKDVDIAHLWLFDGKAAVPLLDAQGKQVSGRQPFMAWQDGRFLLRVKNPMTYKDEYFQGRQAKISGPLLSDSGADTTGMNLLLGRGRTQLYVIDRQAPAARMLRPAP